MSSKKRVNWDEDFVPDSEEVEVDTECMEAAEKKRKKMSKQWKEQEELSFVKEMVRYFEEKKCDPKSNRDDFLRFMRPEVGLDFSQIQLRNKIHRLYRIHKEEKASDQGKVSVGSHKEQMLKLLDTIWGKKVVPENQSNKAKDEEVISGQTCLNELFRYHTKISSRFGIGEDTLTQALDLVEEEKLQEWDQQWKELQLQQMDLNMKAAKLYHDQTQTLLQALKASSRSCNAGLDGIGGRI